MTMTSRNHDRATTRIERAATNVGDHALSDLVDWYRDDLDAMAIMTMEDTVKLVADYRGRYLFYRYKALPATTVLAVAAPELVLCRECADWLPDAVNIKGGAGTCRRVLRGSVYPWTKCKLRCSQ